MDRVSRTKLPIGWVPLGPVARFDGSVSFSESGVSGERRHLRGCNLFPPWKVWTGHRLDLQRLGSVRLVIRDTDVAFRAINLELMLALQRYGNGLRPEHLLVHSACLNSESVKQMPA